MQRGFSLAEVLVALLVLALVITSTLSMFVERQKRMREANETMLAYQVLANESEVRRRIDFAQLDTASPTFVTDTVLLAPLAPFATTVTVAPVSTGVKKVTMTITWRTAQKRAQLSLVRVDTGGTNLW